jgi:hypothetical protein
MRRESRTVDHEIGRTASRAHGVVTREQLTAAGLTPSGVDRRLRAGRLIAVHPGVYRVGHSAPSLEARYLAAVLACGDRAVLAGRAAAHVWRIVKGAAPWPEVIASTERRVRGVITHRTRAAVRTTRWNGIPTTTVAQTLVHLAATLSLADLARACHEAGVLHKTTPRQLQAVMRPNTAGARNLHLVMGRIAPVELSQLETRFGRLLRAARLPAPDETNRPASGRRVDCRWITERLTVELDSFGFHNSRHSWQRDRQREREAYARGDQHRRYTWADVFEDPRAMLAELRALLG